MKLMSRFGLITVLALLFSLWSLQEANAQAGSTIVSTQAR